MARPLPLLGAYLTAQQDLSAVERFALLHERGDAGCQGPRYRSLMPASPPAEGQQYRFEVDLDRCTGCKACVTACHSLNGLEGGRDVALGRPAARRQRRGADAKDGDHHVPPLPGAGLHARLPGRRLREGPADGYRAPPRRPVHRLPVLAFSPAPTRCRSTAPGWASCASATCAPGGWRRTKPRPACRRAPTRRSPFASSTGRRPSKMRRATPSCPASPSPGITVPATRYKTADVFPRNMLPADFYAVRPGHQHLPLVVMLVLTQLSVGAFCFDQLLPLWLGEASQAVLRPFHGTLALGLGLLAMLASTLHLGRPQYAWRAFIGLRTSWLSREIVAFTAFALLATAYAGSLHVWKEAARLEVLGYATAAVGVAAVFSSVMVYHATQRRWWSGARTGFKFALTGAVLGAGGHPLRHLRRGDPGRRALQRRAHRLRAPRRPGAGTPDPAQARRRGIDSAPPARPPAGRPENAPRCCCGGTCGR